MGQKASASKNRDWLTCVYNMNIFMQEIQASQYIAKSLTNELHIKHSTWNKIS
jgi:hypothetical protein